MGGRGVYQVSIHRCVGDLGDDHEEHADVGGLRDAAQHGEHGAGRPDCGREQAVASSKEVEGVLGATDFGGAEFSVPQRDVASEVVVCRRAEKLPILFVATRGCIQRKPDRIIILG